MVLFLNYLPWIIFALGLYAIYKSAKSSDVTKRGRNIIVSALVTVVLMMLLQGLTAGYIPKVRSSQVGIGSPSFTSSEAEIQDRLRPNAKTAEERTAELQEISDWRSAKANRTESKNVPEENSK